MNASQDTEKHCVAMVAVDGARIRRLREDKGLTQLYVATSVEVFRLKLDRPVAREKLSAEIRCKDPLTGTSMTIEIC